MSNKNGYKAELEHREKVIKKSQRLQGLRDLLLTYEEAGIENNEVAALRSRVRRTHIQLVAMGGL